jgi:hypothetical protein
LKNTWRIQKVSDEKDEAKFPVMFDLEQALPIIGDGK